MFIFHILIILNFISFHFTFFSVKNCGANSYTETGNITSPNFPNSYGYNEKCLYLVRIPEAETITFNFLEFDTESNKDDLYINEGTSFIDPFDLQYGLPEGYSQYNGENRDIAPITYNTNQLTLFWESDRNIIRTGFHIFYTRRKLACIFLNVFSFLTLLYHVYRQLYFFPSMLWCSFLASNKSLSTTW